MFTADFFTYNRRQLYAAVQPHGFIILSAHGQMQRSDDGAYPFEQEANFWYLTGIDEAEWWLIYDASADREYLVAPHREKFQQIFDGSLPAEKASETSGIATVLDRKAGRQLLHELLAKNQIAYTLKPRPRKHYGFYTNRAQHDLMQLLKGAQTEDIRLPLARLRAIKQPAEIEAMKYAMEITNAGLAAVQAQLPKLHHEYEIEALLSYEFRRRGAEGHAFEPIVASGQHACTLHYGANNGPLQPQTLVVIDVGARFNHYPADITRTLAIGEPTDRQRSVLAAVQRVHDETIKRSTVGRTVKDYQLGFERVMGEELVHLGLVKKPDDRKGIYTWMPHAVSHGLGVEVHDRLGQPETLQAGMVLTVEPGIYIPDEGIGVRIEDDILVASEGPVVLSGS